MFLCLSVDAFLSSILLGKASKRGLCGDVHVCLCVSVGHNVSHNLMYHHDNWSELPFSVIQAKNHDTV